MNNKDDGLAVLGVLAVGLMLLAVLLLPFIAKCSTLSKPPACRNSVRVLSWLHLTSVTCPRVDQDMTIERIGLKVIMRCTCKETK